MTEPGGAAPPQGDGAGLAEGTRLGRYLIEGVLGHGAMATVFRGRDTELGRTVAIKVMTLAVAARPDAAERFRREAKAAAALKHPGIVEIHDFVTGGAGAPSYIVAELIDGPTLRQLLEQRRRLLPEIAALVGAQVADALAFAHGRGIVHRDIKPDNVMLERAGAFSRVVITDFGVAHIAGLETMTATGALVGSPAYMSPEQARGHDLSPAADVWALGVLLYEMATGAVPFAGRDPLAVIAAIAAGTFRRPSQMVATVGPGFEQVVLRCLRPDPAQRYADAAAAARDLRAVIAGAGITDELGSLRRFLDDGEAFERELRPRVGALAVDRARRHLRRGELARAVAEIGRAQAYVPDHPEARRLLARVSARRRGLRAAAGLLTCVVLAGGGYAAWTAATRARPPAVAPTAPSVAPRAERAPEPPSPAGPPRVEARPAVAAPRAEARPAVAAPQGPARQPRPRREQPSPPAVSGVAADEGDPVPESAPEPEPPPAKPEARPAHVELRAQHGFCQPSLDGHEFPRDFPYQKAVYPSVAPGPHTVFCRLASGAKVRVGDLDVKPDANIKSIVVREGSDLKLQSMR